MSFTAVGRKFVKVRKHCFRTSVMFYFLRCFNGGVGNNFEIWYKNFLSFIWGEKSYCDKQMWHCYFTNTHFPTAIMREITGATKINDTSVNSLQYLSLASGKACPRCWRQSWVRSREQSRREEALPLWSVGWGMEERVWGTRIIVWRDATVTGHRWGSEKASFVLSKVMFRLVPKK